MELDVRTRLYYNATGSREGPCRLSDPEGNVQHCEDHGISKNEVEEVLDNLDDLDISRSSGHPIVFGETNSGRYLMVVFEVVDEDTIYPITAYEVDKRLDP